MRITHLLAVVEVGEARFRTNRFSPNSKP